MPLEGHVQRRWATVALDVALVFASVNLRNAIGRCAPEIASCF